MNKNIRCGAVVIGRNEGQRLITCIDSLLGRVDHIVYVDSGSADGSLAAAKQRGVACVSLDLTRPFTAARARNEGATYFLNHYPDLEFIQFVDGDCEVQPDWVGSAQQFLDENSQYAVVCGRRRERFVEASVYNQLCDIEWDTPIGDALSCGGDALIRVDAFKQLDGYRDDLIAGEEPEMCFRLRAEGWKIYRLDAEMTLHDAAMTTLSQWWKRTTRTGYACTLGCSIHGRSAERYYVKQVLRVVFWGIVLPVLVIALSVVNPLLFSLALIYPLQIFRVGQSRPDLAGFRFKWAASVVLGKLPEAVGLLRFLFMRKKTKIIEYK